MADAADSPTPPAPRQRLHLDLDWEAFAAHAPRRPQQHRVTFAPTARTLTGSSEQTIFEVARAAGVAIPTTCGGKGTCGRCRVAVTGSAPRPSAVERQLLTRADIASGVRLACRTCLTQDLTVTVLPDHPAR